jgi:hypothetical protein
MSGYPRPISAQYEPKLVCSANDMAFVGSEHSVHYSASVGYQPRPTSCLLDDDIPRRVGLKSDR